MTETLDVVLKKDGGVRISQGVHKIILTKEQAVSLAKQIVLKLMP